MEADKPGSSRGFMVERRKRQGRKRDRSQIMMALKSQLYDFGFPSLPGGKPTEVEKGCYMIYTVFQYRMALEKKTLHG